MAVAVMQIRVMGMCMHQRRMPVPVRMRFGVLGRGMLMMVVRVVNMQVLMLERFVRMTVIMRFSQMQVDSRCHQQSGRHQLCGNRL